MYQANYVQSFYIVYQENKIEFISDDFFNLYDCYKSIIDFLKIHQDINELFDFQYHNGRKFFVKNDNIDIPWFEYAFINNSKHNRVKFTYKNNDYYYEFFVSKSYSNNEEYIIYFFSIEQKLKNEKRLVK